jgi:hypothetical protein
VSLVSANNTQLAPRTIPIAKKCPRVHAKPEATTAAQLPWVGPLADDVEPMIDWLSTMVNEQPEADASQDDDHYDPTTQ